MIDLKEVTKFSPQNGDVFQLPEDTPTELCQAFAEAIALAAPGVKALVFRGEIRRLDKAAMNAAGWYRA